MIDKPPTPGIVIEPEPIIERANGVNWLEIAFVVWAVIIGIVLGYNLSNIKDEKPVSSFKVGTVVAMLNEIEVGEPESCEVPRCPDCSFLSRFVHTLDTESATPAEIRDVLNRCYAETRFTPSSVSDTGDWGICQINRKSWPDVDVERLLVDPEYAAVECLRVYRVFYKACGDKWRDCYRRGVRGNK